MSKLLTILISFILGAVVASAIGFYSLPGFMIKEIPSPYGFEETMVKVKAKFTESLPSLEKAHDLNPTDESCKSALKQAYELLDMQAKASAL